jgi:2-polyprenyl-3-methyl-5-hydroxy-6-metoxy-1,4-benzoquinol methylase
MALAYPRAGQFWLEVGSGSGQFLRKLALLGVKAQGVDLTPESGQSSGGHNVVKKSSFDDFRLNIGESVDGIVAFQVLEHIFDVKGFFEFCNRNLKEKGLLILGVPNNNPYLFKFDRWHTLNLPPHHVGRWNEESLKTVAETFGYQVLMLKHEKLTSNELRHLLRLGSEAGGLHGLLSRIGLKLVRLDSFLLFQPLQNLFRLLLEGRNTFAVFEKRAQ